MYTFVYAVILYLLAGRGLAAPLIPRKDSCDCYRTVDAGDIFTSHSLIDFRHGKPPNYGSFFYPLTVPGYSGGETRNQMTASNVIFHPDHLELLTTNKGGQQQSADIESQTQLLYGSFRARFAVTGSAGGVGGFFTFKEGGANECDIEILTNEPKNQIHYTNHISGNGGDNPTLHSTDAGDWSQYLTHRFDWTAKSSTFFLEGKQMAKLEKGMPTEPSTLILNMWSSGPLWGGNMQEGGEANMNVQWIQAFYNQSGGYGSGSGACMSICDVEI